MNSKDLKTTEYGAFYANYIRVIGEVDLLEELQTRKDAFLGLLRPLTEQDMDFRYAPGKWTISELILHIIDSERVFQYRALRFGRGDFTALPGFDQDIYVPNSNASSRTLASLIEEFQQVREASISLFKGFPEQALLNVGVASGNEVSVRAIGFMICGHQKHHEQVLKQRYLAE